MIQFQHIEYLFALAAIIPMWVLYFFVIRWKKNRIKKIGDPALVKYLINDYSSKKFFLKFILINLAFALAVIALANPRKPEGTSNVKRNGIDVMIALDVSNSMLAKDIKPSRLDRSKQLIAKLIDKLSDDRIGIVVFAGRAYLQMPLTTDHAAAKMYLSSASPDVVPTQGTVIGDALKMCYAAFNTKEKKYKSIVLISDGEDHDETADKITEALAGEGVTVNTVGIGSPEGTTIEDAATGQPKKDAEGKMVVTKLNEGVLKNIAAKGNGLYQFFTNADQVANAIESQVKTMGQRSITENAAANYQNFFPWFLMVALLMLTVEFFISERKKIVNIKQQQQKTVSTNRLMTIGTTTLLCMIFLTGFLPAAAFAQSDKELVKKGNEAYNRNQYEAASGNYKTATEINPGNEAAQYNLGNALYKNGKAEDAIQAYDAAITASKLPADKSGAWYNKGVALQNNKKLPECIDAYKNALRLNPTDEDARLNLQKAIQQQQKQEQQKEKKQEKKQQQKQQDQQPKPQPSKMTKKEAEEKLKALLQQEKNLQDKLRKVDAASPDKPEKDW